MTATRDIMFGMYTNKSAKKYNLSLDLHDISSGLYGGQKVESSEDSFFWCSIPFLTIKK